MTMAICLKREEKGYLFSCSPNCTSLVANGLNPGVSKVVLCDCAGKGSSGQSHNQYKLLVDSTSH